MRRVYLSGPMTDCLHNNFPAFHETARALRARGLVVVNPAELDPGVPEPPKGSPAWRAFYKACMRVDIRALMDCQLIALMPGWECSDGAHLELYVAHRVGIEVRHVGELLAVDGGGAA